MTTETASLPDIHKTVPIPASAGFWRRMLAFAGPGYLVAVGYMDPGNWATDIAGGSAFGYKLLSVILISNLLAVLLQSLSVRLGIATGLDLAKACRRLYPRPISMALWVLCEIAICACDLAEIIGTAIALKLLFGLPLLFGIGVTVLDTFMLLLLQKWGLRKLESFILVLILTVACCFAAELWMIGPDPAEVLKGYVPDMAILTDPAMLVIATGILGATVMPHNLYLHSAIVQSRAYGETPQDKRSAIRYFTIDTVIALTFALFVNSAILIMSAGLFHTNGLNDVVGIEQAHSLLAPLLGVPVASVLFALALLASGQNSTITATMAGQVVMEGFLEIRMKPWQRRLLTRLMALVPAVIVCALYGEDGTARLLILSQVVLSLQLPFAVLPLISFTSRRSLMGSHRCSLPVRIMAWIGAMVIIALNMKMLVDFVAL